MYQRTRKQKVNGVSVDDLKRVISVYADRGQKALHLLSEMKIESAEKLLVHRKAAFHNFRTGLERLDIESLGEQNPLTQEVRRVVKLDGEIELAMRRCQEALIKDFQKLSEGRRRLAKFQSKRHFSKGFEQSA